MSPYTSLLLCWIVAFLTALTIQPTYTADPAARGNSRKPKTLLTAFTTTTTITTAATDTEDAADGDDYSSTDPTGNDETEDLFAEDDYTDDTTTAVTTTVVPVTASSSIPLTTVRSAVTVSSTTTSPSTAAFNSNVSLKSKVTTSRVKSSPPTSLASPADAGLSFTDSTATPPDGDGQTKETSSGLIPVSLRRDDHVEGSGNGPSFRMSPDGPAHPDGMDNEDDEDTVEEPYEGNFNENGSGQGPVVMERPGTRKAGFPRVSVAEGSGAITTSAVWFENEKTQVTTSASLPPITAATDDIEFSTPTFSTPSSTPDQESNELSTVSTADPDEKIEGLDTLTSSSDKGVTVTNGTSLLKKPELLAAVIGGAVVGLLCAILLVMYLLYRMRKKDEGSYALEEPTKRPGGYMRAPTNSSKEYYA